MFINRYVRDQMFSFDPNSVEAFGARAVNVVQIERRRIRISDSDTNKMDGLIPVTQPIREDKPRTRFEAMEVDVMGQQQEEESDSDGECECAALQASGRGGPCFYCPKEGHFLRNCPCKAAGLPRSAPLVDQKGGRSDDRRWREHPDPPPARREWSRGRQKEEYGPPQLPPPPPPPPPPLLPTKGAPREPWRDGPERGYKPQRERQALEEEDGREATPEMNVLCGVESDCNEGLFGLREVGKIDGIIGKIL